MGIEIFGDELTKSHRILVEAEKLTGLGGWEWAIVSDTWTMSDNWLRIHGRSRTRMATSDLMHLAHPGDKPAIQKALDRAAARGGPYEIEHRIVRQDNGEVRYIKALGSATRDADGKVVKLTGAVIDITDSRKAEEPIRERENRVRTLQRILPDLIWFKEPDGIYLSCNSRFERFFGASEKDIVGKSDYDYVDRELADSFRAHDHAAIRAGKPCINEEEIVFVDDGHREVLETIKTPVYTTAGQLAGVLGIGRDITERKKTEEALRESEAKFRLTFDSRPDAININRRGCSISS